MAAPAESNEAPTDYLGDLPCVILARVLEALVRLQSSSRDEDAPARSLLRVAACSRRLRAHVSGSEELWKELCTARGWASAAGGASWCLSFAQARSRLCRECWQTTPYVFPLLGPNYRLCDRCEPGSPLYTLLTEAQASASEYGLSPEDLAQLPSREISGLRSRAVEKRLRVLGQATLYLRSHVEARAAELTSLRAGADVPSEAESEDAQFALDEDEPRARVTPEAQRAARKANKAAVKASNRERRAAKSTGAGSGKDYATLSSPHAMAVPVSPSPTRAMLAGALPPRPSPSSALLSRSPGGSGAAAFSSSPGRGGLPPRPGSSPTTREVKRGSKTQHAREAARAVVSGSSPTSSGPLARAWLEDELGAFGISGLELAPAESERL